MEELSTARLYALRALYLLIAVAMGAQIWPLIVTHPANVEHMRGVTRAFLGALTLLCAVGVRYPVKMLPLLIFEFVWKTIWVAAFGVPLWLTHQLTADTAETMKACLMGVVVVPLVIPWGYLMRQLLTSDRHQRIDARRVACVCSSRNPHAVVGMTCGGGGGRPPVVTPRC